MTDYIEQMKKTAGVKMQLDVCLSCLKEDICQYCNKKLLGEYIYPDFTAEKQLELIKLISDFHLYVMNDGTYELRGKYITITDTEGDFPPALAQLTTELINAGELDKEKVKEILEG